MAATPKPKKQTKAARSAISKAYEKHHKGPKHSKADFAKLAAKNKLPPGEFEKRLAKAKKDD